MVGKDYCHADILNEQPLTQNAVSLLILYDLKDKEQKTRWPFPLFRHVGIGGARSRNTLTVI